MSDALVIRRSGTIKETFVSDRYDLRPKSAKRAKRRNQETSSRKTTKPTSNLRRDNLKPEEECRTLKTTPEVDYFDTGEEPFVRNEYPTEKLHEDFARMTQDENLKNLLKLLVKNQKAAQ